MADCRLSYILLSYNEEAYIADAVRSALEQDYFPLEIIISDDCSSDRTFEVIKDITDRYRGSNIVRVRRNTRRMGLAEHLNLVLGLCSGALIFMAAGDDVSMSYRVTQCLRYWESNGRPSCIFSNAVVIDEEGSERGLWLSNNTKVIKNLDEFKRYGRVWSLGCSNAIDRNLFLKYGGISPNIIQEDGVLAFRAILEGGIEYIDRPLVKYRRHNGNIYNFKNRSSRRELYIGRVYMHLNWVRDYRRSGGHSLYIYFICFKEVLKDFLYIVYNALT